MQRLTVREHGARGGMYRMADSTKRQDREVASTAKQDKKGFKVPRIPGDNMLYPLLVGLLLNCFCQQVLAV